MIERDWGGTNGPAEQVNPSPATLGAENLAYPINSEGPEIMLEKIRVMETKAVVYAVVYI